ncbi:MAG: hypothetical protein A2147_09780 [Chloroflexi bacterium RBG_16_57_8]|nr:MAG: hypothetical protein A2147_09780 [Chloroflexi bacterium RBG_16_57_8]
MDTYTKDLRRLEVDDIDDEIYYREMIGCTVKAEGIGTCATASCPEGELRFCQRPGESTSRWTAQGPACGNGCEDAC